MAARGVEVLRQEGPRALLARVASETVYRRLLLLERDLTAPLSVDVSPELEFGYFDEGRLGEYEELRPGRGAAAAARFGDGHRCFGTWRDGRLVAVRWLATGAPHIEYLDLSLPLGDDEIYHYDVFTASPERRRGISLMSQARVFEALRDEGYRFSVRAVLPENLAAVRDAARAGYHPRGRIGYVKLGSWRRPFRTDRKREA